MAESTNATAVSLPSPAAAASTAAPPKDPLWARIAMPSITDIVFVAFLCALTFGNWGPQLLSDADIGWHIRNGEHIMATHSIPHADYFSYTMAGRPWFAWEWLYDLIIAGIHSLAGLNGVVVFSALIIALTFALLFKFALKSSGNLLVAMCLTLLSGAAASIHFLARPHLLTWLFTLIWLQVLDSFQRGERKHLFILPAFMLVWVNLHGGFLVGVALLGLFLAGNVWTWSAASCPKRRGRAQARARHLGIVLLLSVVATVANPYGFRLYTHIHEYLGSTFLMNNNMEYLSPDFHLLQVKCFAVLLVMTLLALALEPKKVTAVDVLLIAFSVWMGLYAARNIPISAVLLTLTIAPMLGAAIRNATDRNDITFWLRGLAGKVDGFATRMGAMEVRFKAHLLPAVVVLVVLLISAGSGAVPQQRLLALHFNEKRMPVRAAEYMASQNIFTHFLAPDAWSGYLIYRLYPKVRVMFDDRHDLYSEAFLRDYMKLMHVQYGWHDVLDANQVNWVVIPPDSPLANTLKVVGNWKVVYDDGTAIIFARTVPIPTN